MEYLNLGCGTRLHPDWTNVDMARTAPGVIAANLTRGVPFPEARFDVVYQSHVLERCGFEGVRRRGAAKSYVPEWPRFNFDTEPDGTVYKPGSLFMGARKLGGNSDA